MRLVVNEEKTKYFNVAKNVRRVSDTEIENIKFQSSMSSNMPLINSTNSISEEIKERIAVAGRCYSKNSLPVLS